jgi:hypothetical protein
VAGGARARIRIGAATAALAGVVSVLASAGPSGAVPIPWRNCGTPGDVITVSQLDASVWPPVHGQQMTISYRMVVKQPVLWGSETVRITMPNGRVVSFTRPFTPPPPLELPLPAGPLDGRVTFTVASWLPSGEALDLHVDATTQEAVTPDSGGRPPRGRQGVVVPLICFDAVIPIK